MLELKGSNDEVMMNLVGRIERGAVNHIEEMQFRGIKKHTGPQLERYLKLVKREFDAAGIDPKLISKALHAGSYAATAYMKDIGIWVG